MKRHRYHQQALGIPGALPNDYSPAEPQLAGPEQGWLALDGGVLGPLFNHTTTPQDAIDGFSVPLDR